jgi:anti-sigma regulatory factor (Ser/Thr protein kinase)
MNNAYLVVDNDHVVCVNAPDQAVTQVTVRGRWDGRLRREVSRVLRACMAETPQLVIVDLVRFDDPAGESAATWQTTSRYAEQSGSPTAVVVCGAAPALRQRLSAGAAAHGAGMRLVESVSAALAAVPHPSAAAVSPSSRQFRPQHISLPPRHSSSALARTMAGDACLAFGVPQVMHAARLIVSELVVNAAGHAGTNIDVRVSRRGTMLHLAVQDRDSRLPRLLDTEPWRPGELLEQQGMGLRVVAAAATAWGALPCQVGKVVWATLATGPQE